MMRTAPGPVDVQDLQFKLRCRLKVFESADGTNFFQPCNLVACASRFGLIFVGTNTTHFQVIQLKHFEEFTKSDGDKTDYQRRNISLPSLPKFLSVNCEHTILAVVIEKNSCACALFYDVQSFWQKDVVQLTEVRLSPTPGVYIMDVNWNPALSAIFTACKSDGTLGIYELKGSKLDINELPAAAGATSFCWSPKGKQIAVGSRDGKITQYKPDLKAVKVINSPPLKESHLLISLQWISNYQFIGMFQPVNSKSQSCLIVIDAPKTGEPTYINFDDICYSNGSTRSVQFYMIMQHQWNVLMVASSNSMEVGVLGHSNDCWTQWIVGDAARAELPLSSDHQETLPVGFGLDIGCMQPLKWGESTLPPCPILLILSHYGMLCCFNVVNLKEGVPTICTPPDPIRDTSGLQHFVNKHEATKQNIPAKEQNLLIQQLNQVSKTTQPTTKNTSEVSSATIFEIQPNMSNKQELNFPTTQPSVMFGGQATLIPFIQKNKTGTPPPQSTGSPIMYQPSHSSINEDKRVTMTTQKSTTPLSSKESAAIVQQQAVTSSSNVNLSKVNQIKSREESAKVDVYVDLKPEEEAEALFAQMVKEECAFLESELRVTLHQGKTLKLNLGGDDDKTKIVESTKSVQDFFKELFDICTTQNSEVHILKQNLLQSWAWYEEIKSRYAASKDESMMILLRAQPLDSASEKQLEDIRHLNYYLESQIAQAHRALDEQWENFQDYCKKKCKMQIPTMEMIFQSMVKQSAILRKQSYVLKDIGSRIKSKSRSAIGSSLLISMDNVKNLPDELKRLRMSPGDICQMQYEHVMSRMKNFTKKKSDSLRKFLKERDCPHISAVKPQLLTSIIQASPSTKVKSISLLDTKTSTTKENIPKKLEFAQSTPKLAITKAESILREKQFTTPIEGLQDFTLRFEAKNFNKKSEPIFSPLSKTVITSSLNSAFVATSLGTVVSASISTSSSFKPVIFGTTTIATSVAKPQLNFVTATTTSLESSMGTTSVSKPFSFVSSSASMFQQNIATANETKPSVTPFGGSSTSTTIVTGTGKPSFSLTPQSTSIPKTVTVTTATVFGNAEAKNVAVKSTTSTSIFDSKPTPVTTSPFSGISFTKSTVTTSNILNIPAISNKSSMVTTTSIFGTVMTSTATSVSPFSISSPQNIFGITTDKSNESVTPTKPFIFSSVAAAKSPNVPSTTAQSRHIVSVTNASVAQLSSFVSSPSVSTETSKTAVTSQPLASSVSPSVIMTSKPQSIISATVSTSSIFSSNQLFSKATVMPAVFTSSTTAQNFMFTAPVSSVSSQPSIFSTGTAKSSIIGTPTTSASVIPAVTTTTTTVSAASTTSSVSGVSTSTVTTTSISTSSVMAPTTLNVVFGTSANSQQNIFGSVASQPSTFTPVNSTTAFSFAGTPSTKPIIFGSTDASVTKSSIFGTAAVSTSTSVFGTTSVTTTQNLSSVFGTPVTSTTQSSIFGNATTATTTQSQIFGMFGDSSQKGSFIFGSTGSTSSTQPSVFGSTSQNTIFGTPSTTSNAATFGQSQSIFDGLKNTPSIFGQSSGFSSSGSSFGSTNIFGAAVTSFGQPGGSVFGNTATTTSGSIFGATPTTASSVFSSTTSVFGTPASTTTSVFGSGNVFSSTTQSTPFVASTSSGAFGFGNLNVGATTTSSSGFGVNQAANPFGGGTKSIFGGSSGTPTSSVFGSGGGSPFSNPTQSFGSTFGGQSVFGQQQSTFGQSAFGGSTFGQQNTGPFSSGTSGTVAQSGFGGSPTFQKPASFGGSPVFGSSPSFGSAPSFGGAPAFGSPPTFGSPPKIFGSGGSSFGATPNTQNASFGNLANQPTVGFGNLAQQASNTPTPTTPFSGSSSFSSWR